MHNPNVDWCYNTEPDETMNNRSIRYPRGKTLGGSSSINGLLYVRGQHRDYDVWRQLGNKGWSWEDVLPYFIKAENQERGESEFHGVGGPLSVSDQRIQLPLLNQFQKAAEEFGIPKTKDFNTGDNHGCGYFQVTEKDGFRCSTAVGYLNPAKKRPNLKIIINAHVKKINFEDMQNAINSENIIIINTLPADTQACLIKNTVDINNEIEILNNSLSSNKDITVVIYGMNASDETIVNKYNQLLRLGLSNVYVYPGGLFEWLLLQDIYGDDVFQTSKKELDICLLYTSPSPRDS